jgi:A nuclease family of the HNH/ENDO VII superfamily with conserved AHH
MRPAYAARARRIPFRSVNLPGIAGYDPGLQRHHLLPRQLLHEPCFARLIEIVGRESIGYDDFRCNGLLLPASERMALRIGLPLHRGPHRDYNAMVIARVGQIESGWGRRRLCEPGAAREEALFRLRLLQRGLRRRLLDPRRRPILLNRRQLVGPAIDFAELDAMAEMLWGELEGVQAEVEAPSFAASELLAA